MPSGMCQPNASRGCEWEGWVAECKDGLLTHAGVQRGAFFKGETGQCLDLLALLLTRAASHRIVCATGPAAGAFSDVVTVNASKEGKSRERFSYVVRRTAACYPALPTGHTPGG